MQIPLALKLPPASGLHDFVADNRTEIIQAVDHVMTASGHEYLFIHGEAGTGKTHLLSAICQRAEHQELSFGYIPLRECSTLSPEILDDLENREIVCLDDIEAISGIAAWETAVFNLYNRLRENNNRLIVTSRLGARQLPLALADLQSRLCWGISIPIPRLSDEHKKHILAMRASSLGMELPEETIEYLFNNHSRSLAALLEILAHLDTASLTHQRKLTIPFVRQQLQHS